MHFRLHLSFTYVVGKYIEFMFFRAEGSMIFKKNVAVRVNHEHNLEAKQKQWNAKRSVADCGIGVYTSLTNC